MQARLVQNFSTTNIETIRNTSLSEWHHLGHHEPAGHRLAERAVNELVKMQNADNRWEYFKKLRNDPKDGRLASFLVLNGCEKNLMGFLAEYHQNEKMIIMSGDGVIAALAVVAKPIWLRHHIIEQPRNHRDMMLKEGVGAIAGMIEHGFANDMLTIIRQSQDKESFFTVPLVLCAFEKMGKVGEVREIIEALSPIAKARIYHANSQGQAYQGNHDAFGLAPSGPKI